MLFSVNITVPICYFTGTAATRIDASEFFGRTALKELTVKTAGLKEFPNFTYVANTMEKVDLSENSLTTVPAVLLDLLVKLKFLVLISNSLTSLPDVAGPSSTLVHIYINGNEFKEFPSMKKLGRSVTYVNADRNKIEVFDPNNIEVGQQSSLKLHLKFNKLTTIPPMIVPSGNFPRVDIYVQGNPLKFDYRLSWVGGSKVNLYRASNVLATLEDLAKQKGIINSYIP